MTLMQRIRLWWWRQRLCAICDTCPTSEPCDVWCKRESLAYSVQEEEGGNVLNVTIRCERAHHLLLHDPDWQDKRDELDERSKGCREVRYWRLD